MAETITIRGADGGIFSYTLERVLQGLLQTLANGQVDEAAHLYAGVREDIAYQLIAKAQGNNELFQQVANLFHRARDYQRAAYCCEQMDEPEKAADLYARAGDPNAAAHCYAAAGQRLKAAEMFERGHNHIEAARLFLGEPGTEAAVRAALCFEKGNRPFDAAQAFEKAGKNEKALALYQAVDDDSPDKKTAAQSAAALLARSALRPAPVDLGTPLVGANVGGVAGVTAGSDDAKGSSRVTLMEGFDFLKRLPLFSDLSLADLKSTYHLCEVITAPIGEKLVTCGQASTALWVILEGNVEVRTGAGREIARLAAGDHVGEMSLFDDAPASVDVVTATTLRALRLNKGGLRDLMAANDAFAVSIWRVLFLSVRDRLRATTDRLSAGGS